MAHSRKDSSSSVSGSGLKLRRLWRSPMAVARSTVSMPCHCPTGGRSSRMASAGIRFFQGRRRHALVLIGLREVDLLPDRVLEELAVGGQRAFGHDGGSRGRSGDPFRSSFHDTVAEIRRQHPGEGQQFSRFPYLTYPTGCRGGCRSQGTGLGRTSPPRTSYSSQERRWRYFRPPTSSGPAQWQRRP